MRVRRLISGAVGSLCVAVAVLPACACVPGVAAASETVELHASFTPDRLGASTTIGLGFQISGPDGQAPSPLTRADLRLPSGIEYLTSTLGLAVCEPAVLLAHRVRQRAGRSPVGRRRRRRDAQHRSVHGPSTRNGDTVVVFYADGRTPVAAQVVFEGELIPGFGPFSSGSLDNAVPLVAGVPEGPDVSIRSVQTTIGPGGLLYTRRVHGRTVHFHPSGVGVPEHCPRGGFRFAARFGFADGTTASAASTVPCPARRHGQGALSHVLHHEAVIA